MTSGLILVSFFSSLKTMGNFILQDMPLFKQLFEWPPKFCIIAHKINSFGFSKQSAIDFSRAYLDFVVVVSLFIAIFFLVLSEVSCLSQYKLKRQNHLHTFQEVAFAVSINQPFDPRSKIHVKCPYVLSIASCQHVFNRHLPYIN